MQITVKTIKPCDYDTPFPKMEAEVMFYDETAEYHNSASIHVFIDKRDALLSDLKEESIQTAIGFLKAALESRV
ncbi:MAG: hypothetical protein PHH28_11785 [Desulfuromonadaceae bacterium]|nr:hypothetical protein [Desulfuromonadaceae bacterium]